MTTTAVASSPSPRAASRAGGALYDHASVVITTAIGSSSGRSDARSASTSAAASATRKSTSAAASATPGGKIPSGSTRLPPDQRVGVRFARSASRSK